MRFDVLKTKWTVLDIVNAGEECGLGYGVMGGGGDEGFLVFGGYVYREKKYMDRCIENFESNSDFQDSKKENENLKIADKFAMNHSFPLEPTEKVMNLIR